MKRLALLALLLVPASALAQEEPDRFSASVDGGAEYTSNPRLEPADSNPEGDTVLIVHPSIEGRLERRGFLLSGAYDVRYWQYTSNSELSRALHDLRARAALTYWESLELEGYANLIPTPLTFGGPIDDPTNNVQSAHLGGKVGYRRELGRSNRIEAGYVGEQVSYLEVHKDDVTPPEYLLHDPGLSFERDVGKRYTVGLGYRFRVQDFATANAPSTGDVTAHALILKVNGTPTDWLTFALAGGAQQASFENSAVDPVLHRLVDLSVRGGGEIAFANLSYSERFATDLAGEPATMRHARLGLDYEPFAPWAAGLGVSYGAQDLVSTAGTPARTFVQADVTLAYRVRAGVIELAASHYTSPEDGPTTPKIDVTRAGLRLGGRF